MRRGAHARLQHAAPVRQLHNPFEGVAPTLGRKPHGDCESFAGPLPMVFCGEFWIAPSLSSWQ
jgi:hypothetical protein